MSISDVRSSYWQIYNLRWQAIVSGGPIQLLGLCSVTLALVGAITFGAGWLRVIEWRWSGTPTPPLNSSALALIGIAIMTSQRNRGAIFSTVLALIAAAIGIMKLHLAWMGWLTGPVSASSFVMIWLLAAALILRNRGHIAGAQIAALLAVVHPLVSLIGYAYGMPGFILPMIAVYGSALLAGIAILCQTADRGFIKHIVSPDPAGEFHRIRFLFCVIVIIVVNFVAARILLDPYSISTLVTAMVAFMVVATSDIASYLERSARAHYRSHKETVDDALVAEIDRALEYNEFSVNFQPQIDLRSERVVGVEALVRWNHPVRGLISPADFIPASEASGRILALGEWILEAACMQGIRWRGNALAEALISVNVSPVQLQSSGFVDTVKRVLQRTSFPAQRLVIELTESALVRRGDPGFKALWDLHELGLKIAVDDFGIGYSCLSYLYDLPVDFLKIDQSFVRALPGNPRAETIARTIVGMGHGLGLSIIAEGIETTEQAEFLKQLRCNKAQGYLYARPLDEHALLRWVGERAQRHTQPGDANSLSHSY
ncbi:putative bifunctional diguanylate cyclase/phosphodiesterase [Bradyrhizobium manausense]|uniref:putative bifunctional diguanylate cyclase/phosphodiesterase n=1 Tax=Bradyrhizobium manausense TaxID=989370 RepID=UPI001BA64EB8|nr:EAL domain-containing protein [Bradyrhizobium manausense]MBR0725547.1 EAL domain-containing protein [Bradyrhizobium manausense]